MSQIIVNNLVLKNFQKNPKRKIQTLSYIKEYTILMKIVLLFLVNPSLFLSFLDARKLKKMEKYFTNVYFVIKEKLVFIIMQMIIVKQLKKLWYHFQYVQIIVYLNNNTDTKNKVAKIYWIQIQVKFFNGRFTEVQIAKLNNFKFIRMIQINSVVIQKEF